jgi:hypothetical protein
MPSCLFHSRILCLYGTSVVYSLCNTSVVCGLHTNTLNISLYSYKSNRAHQKKTETKNQLIVQQKIKYQAPDTFTYGFFQIVRCIMIGNKDKSKNLSLRQMKCRTCSWSFVSYHDTVG